MLSQTLKRGFTCSSAQPKMPNINSREEIHSLSNQYLLRTDYMSITMLSPGKLWSFLNLLSPCTLSKPLSTAFLHQKKNNMDNYYPEPNFKSTKCIARPQKEPSPESKLGQDKVILI